VIWLAESFAEPHRSALDWLNQVTESRVRFLGIEIELWRIGQSLPAPKFNLVCKPNEWQKAIARKTSGLSGSDELYLQFWKGFRDYCEKEGTTLMLNAAQPIYWQWSGVGRTGFGLNFSVSVRKKRMGAELYVDHEAAHRALAQLEADSGLVNELGPGTEFQKLANNARIVRYSDCDVNDRRNWPTMFTWMKKNGEELKSALQHRVKALALGPTETEDEPNEAR
jgi:hypothetical protein